MLPGKKSTVNKKLEKIIIGISNVLKSSLLGEVYANKNGLLQKFDPRSKLICSLIFLITISLLHSLPILIVINLFSILIVAWSKIPLKFFLKRVWIFLPFFTGIIALPAIFNIFSPGQVFVNLFNIPLLNITLSITRPGITAAAFLILRVSTSVAFMMLLILTTRWMDILKALEVIRVPSILITILGMTYRYIFVLLSITDNMILARKSRLVGRLSGKEERRILLSSLGVLFMKSFSLSEEVYLAMLSRGYRGKVYTLNNFIFTKKDIFLVYLSISICLGIMLINRL